jgi:hypothetical protein
MFRPGCHGSYGLGNVLVEPLFFLSGIALDGKKKHHFVLKQKDRVLPKGQSFLRVNAICQFERFECVPGRPSAIFQVK